MSIETILSAHTHKHNTQTGTRTHEHGDYTKLNLDSVKRASDRDFETGEDSSTERKTQQVCSFWKGKVVRFDLTQK